jgi:hypothetical protein
MASPSDIKVLLAAVKIVGIDLVIRLKLLDCWSKLENEVAVGASEFVGEIFQLVIEESSEYGSIASLDHQN